MLKEVSMAPQTHPFEGFGRHKSFKAVTTLSEISYEERFNPVLVIPGALSNLEYACYVLGQGHV